MADPTHPDQLRLNVLGLDPSTPRSKRVSRNKARVKRVKATRKHYKIRRNAEKQGKT